MADSVQGSVSMSGRPVNPNTPQRTSRKRPADFTGMQKQKLEAAHAEELKIRQQELGLAMAEKSVADANRVVDYTGHVDPAVEDIDMNPVEVLSPEVYIRVNYPIEDMTFGRDVFLPGDKDHPLGLDATEPYIGSLKFYSFEEGVQYKVRRELAEHLDAKNYLWH